MAKEVACEVKEKFVLSSGFRAWCGRKWPESRPDDGSAPACQDCVKAKAKAEGAEGGGGLLAWLMS